MSTFLGTKIGLFKFNLSTLFINTYNSKIECFVLIFANSNSTIKVCSNIFIQGLFCIQDHNLFLKQHMDLYKNY